MEIAVARLRCRADHWKQCKAEVEESGRVDGQKEMTCRFKLESSYDVNRFSRLSGDDGASPATISAILAAAWG